LSDLNIQQFKGLFDNTSSILFQEKQPKSVLILDSAITKPDVAQMQEKTT